MPNFDFANSLYETLTWVAGRQSDAPALTFLDSRLRPTHYTYRHLFDCASDIARALAIQVPEQSAPIGILLRSQEAQILHYLAVLGLGCVPAILTPPNRKLNLAYYLENVRAVLETCRFHALITDLDIVDLPMTVLEPFTLREVRHAPATESFELRDVAFLQFSSGTTGFKRGVAVTNRAILRQVQAYAQAIALTPSDRIISWLPLYHDMGLVACLNMPLACGVHCIMLEPLDWVANPCSYLRAASDHGATLGWNPNFAYAFMANRARPADLADLDLSALRGLVNCSEAVTWESQRCFLNRFTVAGLRPDVFFGCYAMAETTFALTHGRTDEPNALDHHGPAAGDIFAGALPLVSAGRPLPGVEIRIAGSDGNGLPDRHLGELLVRSPFDFEGYYNNREATRDARLNGWYRTGDLGYRVGEEVFVCGRSKDILIVGGINVFPQDIEDVASRVDGVRPGRVVAFSEFDALVQSEKIIVLAETNAPAQQQTHIVTNVRQRILAAFQIANFDVHLVPPEWLTKSSSGKIARQTNRTRWAALK